MDTLQCSSAVSSKLHFIPGPSDHSVLLSNVEAVCSDDVGLIYRLTALMLSRCSSSS